RTASLDLKRGNIWQLGGSSSDARPIFDGNLLRRRGAGTRNLLRRRGAVTVCLNAGEHERSSSLLLGSEAHIAFVDKADRAAGIERVGIEDLLILFATGAARRLLAGRCDHSDCRSAGGGTGRASEAGRTTRTRGAGRTGLSLRWRLALPA